jgi:fatty acid desaturase
MSSPWNAVAKNFKQSLPARVREQIRGWNRLGDTDAVVRRANLVTQAKVAAIYATFVAALAAYQLTGGRPTVSAASVVVLGVFALPFLRVFMHSQSHWGVGNGPVRNWLLDHGISLLFGVPQTGYKYGHLAHHRYDNDYDPTGFPKDLQSTYIFSRDRRPANIVVWCLFYVTVYQHAVHLYHTVNAPKRREVFWFAFEYGLIVALHAALFHFAPGFYLTVYLPSLVIAWLVSAVSLYMMHAVDADDYEVHPTLNTRDRFFNWFGDNDGYHMEHSLYPHVHQVFLGRVSDLIQPPAEQVLDGQYVTAAFRRFFAPRPKPATAPKVVPAAKAATRTDAVPAVS